MTVLYASACRIAYESLAFALNSVSEPDRLNLKDCAPVFQSSRPAQNGSATAMASRLTSERVRSGRVPAAQNRIRSRTKSSFCECRIWDCNAVFLGALWRFWDRVENEIGKRRGLGAILNAVQCLSAPRGSVDVTQMAQASRLGYRVGLEPHSSTHQDAAPPQKCGWFPLILSYLSK